MIALDPGVTAAIITGSFSALGAIVGLIVANRARRRKDSATARRDDQLLLRDIIHEQREELERKDVQIAALDKKVERLGRRRGGVSE